MGCRFLTAAAYRKYSIVAFNLRINDHEIRAFLRSQKNLFRYRIPYASSWRYSGDIDQVIQCKRTNHNIRVRCRYRIGINVAVDLVPLINKIVVHQVSAVAKRRYNPIHAIEIVTSSIRRMGPADSSREMYRMMLYPTALAGTRQHKSREKCYCPHERKKDSHALRYPRRIRSFWQGNIPDRWTNGASSGRKGETAKAHRRTVR